MTPTTQVALRCLDHRECLGSWDLLTTRRLHRDMQYESESESGSGGNEYARVRRLTQGSVPSMRAEAGAGDWARVLAKRGAGRGRGASGEGARRRERRGRVHWPQCCGHRQRRKRRRERGQGPRGERKGREHRP